MSSGTRSRDRRQSSPPRLGKGAGALVILTGLLGLLLPLWATYATMYRIGAFPDATVEASGRATLGKCSRSWHTLFECPARVQWQGETDPQQTTVTSHSDLSGATSEVERHPIALEGGNPDPFLVIPVGAPSGRATLGSLVAIAGIALALGGSLAGVVLGTRIVRGLASRPH